MNDDDLLQQENELDDADLLYEEALAELESGPKEINTKLRSTEITRWAFQQNDLDLSAVMPREHVQALIKALTDKHVEAMEHYEGFINRRFTAVLLTLIPKTMRSYYNKYPQAFVRHPGFLYENPKGHLFWAVPKVPYFFKQGQEPDILRSARAKYLTKIDQAINQYYEHKRLHGKRQVQYAMRLVKSKVVTYYDLLKYNALWFETLYKEVIK